MLRCLGCYSSNRAEYERSASRTRRATLIRRRTSKVPSVAPTPAETTLLIAASICLGRHQRSSHQNWYAGQRGHNPHDRAHSQSPTTIPTAAAAAGTRPGLRVNVLPCAPRITERGARRAHRGAPPSRDGAHAKHDRGRSAAPPPTSIRSRRRGDRNCR